MLKVTTLDTIIRGIAVRFFAVLFIAVTMLAGPVVIGTAKAQDATIGHIKSVKGEAKAMRAGGDVALAVGDPVYREDVLETSTGGALGVIFLDNTILSLGPRTTVTLRDYEFEPATEKISFLARITRGTLLYVSGVIAKLSPSAVSIETPVATVAVRGTRFLAQVKDDGG